MGYTKEQRAAKAAQKLAETTAILGGGAVLTNYSDEAMMAKTEGKLLATPGFSFDYDQWNKDIDSGYNGLYAAIDKIKEPGWRYRGINPKNKRPGQDRGWQPVEDKNGRQVQVGELILGRMPETAAVNRTNKYARMSSDKVAKQEEIVRAQGGSVQITKGDVITNFRG